MYHKKGELEKALDFYQRSLKLKEQIGNPSEIAQSLGAMTLLYRQKNDTLNELRQIGRALFLLPHLPNPGLQRTIAFIFQETLQSIAPQEREKLLQSALGAETAMKILEMIS